MHGREQGLNGSGRYNTAGYREWCLIDEIPTFCQNLDRQQSIVHHVGITGSEYIQATFQQSEASGRLDI